MLSGKYTFDYDIKEHRVVGNCTLKPSEVKKAETPWLYAINNKYIVESLNPAKIGKWMIFLKSIYIDSVWLKVKEAVEQGHLWHTKVSNAELSNPTHVIIVYTKDYSDLVDVIDVLDFLEKSGIKPADTVIRYKTDNQTRANIYAHGKTKASIYASDTIRQKYDGEKRQSSITSWLTNRASSSTDTT